MLKLDVRIGEALQIGDSTCMRFEHKSGNRVRLAIATALTPIRVIPTGIIPNEIITGVSGEPEVIRPRILAAAS